MFGALDNKLWIAQVALRSLNRVMVRLSAKQSSYLINKKPQFVASFLLPVKARV
jgi:hypothetical protein